MTPDLRQGLDALARRIPDDAGVTRLGGDVQGMVAVVRRRRATRHAAQGVVGLAAVAAIVLGGASLSSWFSPDETPPAGPGATERPRGSAESPAPTPGTSPPVPCAEFPLAVTGTADYEGWWNGSPADSDASILRDPADWPSIVREHPRTVLIDTTTGEVVSAWDRIACAQVTPAPPEPDPAWPAASIVILDADTGSLVDSFPKRREQ